MAGIAMLACVVPASAQNISCAVVGAVQGPFQTNHGVGGDTKQIPVLFLTEEISVPIDPATGAPTGRRLHSPLTIIKNLDPSSIQFFQAAATSETLESVTCTLYRGRGDGATRAYFKIVLTNAVIVVYKDAGDGVNGDAHGDEHERISFTYQRIALSDLESNTTALDNWAL
jgi:type VI secretion system secreted protein Hcp